MIIYLTNEYRINTSDAVCPIILEKLEVKGENSKNAGQKTWKAHLYPANMRGLESTLERLGLSQSESLDELREIMNGFSEAVRDIMKEMKK